MVVFFHIFVTAVIGFSALTIPLMQHKLLSLFFSICCFSTVFAQKFPEHQEPDEPRNKGKAILLHMAFASHIPAGDMADRFGNNLAAGGGLEFITENNWILGAEGHFLFGNKVHEDPLAVIRTDAGDIIGNNMLIASVVLRQRGGYLGVVGGKLLTFNAEKRSGLRLTLGAGLLRHRIRVQDDSRTVTQITGDYAKGYDRLTGGLALQQFIGWQHLGSQRRSNWMLGLEFNQGFTNTLRDWDFTERRKLDGSRLDLRFGIRAAWTLPFYQKKASEIFY
jgi:hypothetical protein